MRLFLWILGIFASTASLAVLVRFNVGNVVLFFPPYRIDISLNFFLLLLLLSFILLYLILRGIANARQMPKRVALWRTRQKEEKSNRALRSAIKSLFEGRFVQAAKEADDAANLPENVGQATLIAARAAHALQQYAQRDSFLLKAAQIPDFRDASLITRLELLVDEHQTQAALRAVEDLNASGARHVHVQRWALKAHQQAKNWEEVLRLVQSLDKHHAIRPTLAVRLKELAWGDLLVSMRDPEHLNRMWKNIPFEDRIRPYIAVRAAEAFQRCELDMQAREIVEKALDTQWDDRLIRAYRKTAEGADEETLIRQIEHCENWLKYRPQDIELLLTLGTLCFKQQLWGKAQRFLNAVIFLKPDPHTLQETQLMLAQLYEALEKPDEAARHYRESALVAKQ